MPRTVCQETSRLRPVVAHTAPLVAHRPAVYQGQAHTQPRDKESLVGEGIRPEFIALINYGIVGLIQLEMGFADTPDISADEALSIYDKKADEALQLMIRKNHDYDEAWRSMRVSSYTDFILTKIQRVKEIEDIHGATLVSEGIDANYMDIINYAVFGLIKLS